MVMIKVLIQKADKNAITKKAQYIKGRSDAFESYRLLYKLLNSQKKTVTKDYK